MRIEWKLTERQLERRLARYLAPRLERAADILDDEITTRIGVMGPPRSEPGEPPRIDTGALIRSIDTLVDAGDMAAYVGTEDEGAPHLEEGAPGINLEPRPVWRQTLIDLMDEVARAFE